MKFIRRFLMLLAMLLVIAGVFIWTCPASFAYRWASDRLGPVKLSGISGSVWKGHAASIMVFDQTLGALDWQLDAAPLLHREIAARIELHDGVVAAVGQVQRNRDGYILLRDIHLDLPAFLFAPMLDIPALKLLGKVNITLAHATVQNGWVNEVDGNAHWSEAGTSGAAEARFGDLIAEFSSTPTDNTITGVVSDGGGLLAVSGMFQVHAGKFDANATLSARDNNPQILEALRYIGEPQPDGTSQLKIHGDLFKLF